MHVCVCDVEKEWQKVEANAGSAVEKVSGKVVSLYSALYS